MIPKFYWKRTPAVPFLQEEIKNNVRKNSGDEDSFRQDTNPPQDT